MQRDVLGSRQALIVKPERIDCATNVDQAANLGAATAESWNVRQSVSIRDEHRFRNGSREAFI